MSLLHELQKSVDAYNEFLAKVWEAKQPELRFRLDVLAKELAESETKIQRIEKVELNAAEPPALSVEPGDDAREQRLRLRCPGDGHWSLYIRLRASILGVHTFEVRVGKLKVTATVNFARGARNRARLLPASGPRVTIEDFDPDASNVIIDAILKVAEPVLKKMVRNLIRKAVADALPSFAAVQRIESLRLASVWVLVPGQPTPMRRLKRRARAISALVQKEHLPFRTLLPARLDGPDAGDPLDTYTHFGDSAIWTGHYVAAEAFRHAATQGKERKSAADNILVGLKGLEALIHISGEKGLLSRVLVRSDSRHRATMAAEMRHPLFSGSFRGVDYTSESHITRDQYAGAFLGAGMALELVQRPSVQRLARRLVRDMTRYLIEVDWCPEEAIPDPETGRRVTSVTYLSSPSQILAILQLARRVDPDAFEDLFERHRDLNQVSWLMNWLQTLDPHSSYYKYNLEHSMALLLLGLEADKKARAELADGFRTLRRALRNHANAYFNLVELMIFEDQPKLMSRRPEQLAEEARQLMTAWLERPPIMEKLDRSDDNSLDLVPFRGLSAAAGDPPEMVARQPLPVEDRPGTDFLWQRSPFGLLSLDINPLRAIRPPGVDLLLPYWMGRKLGVFTAS